MKLIAITLIILSVSTSSLASNIAALQYNEKDKAKVSFDVSMPIDSTGYKLHGKNLTGGAIKFSDRGTYISPLLASESATLKLPVVSDNQGNTLIKTNINYNVIKFINNNGISNFFIKIGMGERTQQVSGLDPSVLKNGTYNWQAPIFSVGKESNNTNNISHNHQFMQIGSLHSGPASKNVMYTQDIYLHTKGKADNSIIGQPIKNPKQNQVLAEQYTNQYYCKVDGLWGAGGADPYETITGICSGKSTTFAAGPNLDYEHGSFTFPTVHTPWSATPKDHCTLPGGKKSNNCVNASIGTNMHYIAQKIRVPINDGVTLFAESGTAYRNIKPTNLRYICKNNIYLKNILPKSSCLKKSYKAGGASYTYFAVGYDYTTNDGVRYSARYINLPGQENANRLA